LVEQSSACLGGSESIEFGVAHNPNPVSSVRGVDGASWNNDRFDFVTFRFQVSVHLVECQADDSNNILTNDPSWPCLLYDSEHFWPEIAVIVLASPLPGVTEWLAGKSSREKSDSSICRAIERFDVSVDWDIRPMLFEDGLGVGFVVAESNGLKSSPSSGKSKSSNTAEQVEVGWVFIHASTASRQ
jgi:hypothetical protein